MDQGDQIGQFFAYWAIVYFGKYFCKLKKKAVFWPLFCTVLIWTKMGGATFFHKLSPCHELNFRRIGSKREKNSTDFETSCLKATFFRSGQKPLKVRQRQGCQMVYFQTEDPNLGKFWRALQWKLLVCFMTIWSILRPSGLFYCHLVYFTAIWYILWSFGIFSPVKLCCTKKIWQPWTMAENCNFPKVSKEVYFDAAIASRLLRRRGEI
jgi:hypothetical protein